MQFWTISKQNELKKETKQDYSEKRVRMHAFIFGWSAAPTFPVNKEDLLK